MIFSGFFAYVVVFYSNKMRLCYKESVFQTWQQDGGLLTVPKHYHPKEEGN
jgi:hypothetical protein